MRTCLVETTAENLPIILRLLPSNITAIDQRLDQPAYVGDRTHRILRLAGDGLPAWCEEDGMGPTRHAVLEILHDNTFRFIPGCGLPDEQVSAHPRK